MGACAIQKQPGAQTKGFVTQAVVQGNALQLAPVILLKRPHFEVIGDGRPRFGSALHEGQAVAGVIQLPIVVQHRTVDAGRKAGHPAQRLAAAQPAALRQLVFSRREKVVQPQSNAEIQSFPPTESGGKQRQGMGQVGRIGQQGMAFRQAMPYLAQLGNIEIFEGLLQITHARG